MKFKKEFTQDEFKQVGRKIMNLFKQNKFSYKNSSVNSLQPVQAYSFNYLDSIFGFAYTSSGICAGYWACNGAEVFSSSLPSDYIYFVGVCISQDGLYYAIFQDENEKEFNLLIK